MLVELDISGSIAIVKLNRPERANALNPELLKLLARLQDQLRRNHRMRAVITLAEGPGFSAGSDLEELGGVSPKVAVQSQWLEARVCRGFLALPQPTIAAVHGYALGEDCFWPPTTISALWLPTRGWDVPRLNSVGTPLSG